MKILKSIILFTAFVTSNIFACTGIKLIAKDGSVVHGRTLEFGVKIESDIAFIPRNYNFTATTPNGKGLKYKSKYAAIGAIIFNNLNIMDGINEKGLSVGTFYFPGFATYSEVTDENQNIALSPLEFPNWLLTNFQSIDEIKNAIGKIALVSISSKDFGDIVPPFHFIVYEKNGDSLVIEPINGKLITYDNPIGVITNAPAFDWHMLNLRNYVNLKIENAPPITIRSVTLEPFGQGAGSVGLPGDFTSPSRFVKATLFSSAALEVENAEKGVFQAFHILNQFDIPKGVARSVVQNQAYIDYTMYTCVKDPTSLKYYLKTYENQNIKVVDLNKFDWDSKKAKKVSISGYEKAIDISSDFKIIP